MAIVTDTTSLTTTNATTTTLWTSPAGLTGGFIFYVSAYSFDTFDRQIWAGHVSRSDGDNSIVATNIHAQAGTAGGSTWTIAAVESGDSLVLEATGDSGETIEWVLLSKYYT